MLHLCYTQSMAKEDKVEGLTSKEASEKLLQFGHNEITDSARNGPLRILLRLVRNNFIIYLLFFGAIVSFYVGEQLTGITILAVLLIIIGVTFIQEFRAEQSIRALRQMIMQVSRVVRDGREQEVLSKKLVPGDLVILRLGEKVPADSMVIDESELEVDESVLTGESRAVKKKTGDPIYMGSFITNGKCQAQVLHTGMNTKFGSIANMISEAEKSLPLQDKVNRIAGYMVVVAVFISILTGFLMISRAEAVNSETISGALILIIALCVSAFPEGLPVVLTTTLAVGATRMAGKNAIVNRMSIIETLGETTVICADKTGTITRGEMTAKKIVTPGGAIDVGGAGFEVRGGFSSDGRTVEIAENLELKLLLETAILCNDAKIERTGEDEEYKVLGTPTEGALLILAAKANIFREDLEGSRLEEIPFSSERKMMSVLHKGINSTLVLAKGAPETILLKCKYMQKDGKTIPLTDEEKKHFLQLNKKLTRESFRTIALGFKEADSGKRDYQEEDLIFLGLIALEDPPREEIAGSLKICKEAGIAVKMITGDHRETALAIADEIGLSGEVLEGDDLDKLTDDELSKIIRQIAIFTRVRPEHKIRIVRVLKQLGEVVTMTGDGVNDAPALKEADIGVAMGRTGTDVSRSVADLTIKDDNFATIVEAIKEGRTIFTNIRKFVSYQLSCNFTELFVLLLGVILAPVFGWGIPILLALQILFMNLVTDDLPAIMLGLNKSSFDVMKEGPRRKAAIFNIQLLIITSLAAVLMTILVLISFYLSSNILLQNLETARTTAMVSLILLEIAGAFHFRSFRYPVLTRSPFVNVYLFWASLASLLATALILYAPLNAIFEAVPLGLWGWIVAMGAAVIFTAVFDVVKKIKLFSIR